MESTMNLPKIVTQSEWVAARRELLAKEKAATRQRDAIAADLRALPMVKVEKDYTFEGPNGHVKLRDLFGPHRQLITYHFMFDPHWEEGCKSCSHFADNVAGTVVHLGARETAFAVVSRAALAKLRAFEQRMGWTFPWYSSSGTEFNYDFHVTLDEEKGAFEYNFADAETLLAARKIWYRKGEMPGMSVFLRDGDDVFHTYSTYQRGLDPFLNTYNLLDVTPLGRQEGDGPAQGWIRHHDRYPG
jgi:predicted dithiol-disulfide oxidoreductase (DUF899 family)